MRDSDLDLLLAAETSELEAIEPAKELAPSPPGPVLPAMAMNACEKLDDVTVREDEPQETLGDEDEAEPVATNELEVVATESSSATARPGQVARPDLRLENFAPNRAALRNHHIKPLINLARRIVARIGDQHSVQRLRITGILSAAEPRARVTAEDRARAVAGALRAAVDGMWPGIAARIEFTTATRAVENFPGAQRLSPRARRAVEVLVETAETSQSVVRPRVLCNQHGLFVWQLEGPQAHEATSASEPKVSRPMPALSAAGYFFVLSSEVPPSRWICSLEVTMESVDPKLAHAVYAAKLSATGLLVSPRHILTAAHCVFSRLQESSMREQETSDVNLEDPALVAKSIAVFPGRSGGAFPFGSYMIRDAKCIRASARWRVSRAANIDSDFALLTLDRPLATGSWGKPPYHITPLPDDHLQGAVVYTAGYPQPDGAGHTSPDASRAVADNLQWSTFGSITEISRYGFSHDLPYKSGQDGSPVWIQQGGDRKLAGILIGKNRALRLTAHTIKILRKWVAQDGCWSAT